MNALTRATALARAVPHPPIVVRNRYIPHPLVDLPHELSLVQRAREQCFIEMFETMFPPEVKRGPSVKRIVNMVARYYGISYHDIVSPRRVGRVIRPRHVAMYLAKDITLIALTDIGRNLGGRDHSTVHSGIRSIQRSLDAGDLKLAADIQRIKQLLSTGEN